MENQYHDYQKALIAIREQAQSLTDYRPTESLRLSTSNGSQQYYTVSQSSPGCIKYIPKRDLETARRLATRDYCIKLIKEIDFRLRLIKSISSHQQVMDIASLNDIYDSLPPGRKKIVDPIIITNAQFINEWYDAHTSTPNQHAIQNNIYTNRGELVRSKSEKILADLFYTQNIPYVYECPFYYQDDHCLSPDFTLLNTRTRKTWIWEHFGLMSDSHYSESFCRKIGIYQKCGCYIGDGLIATFESQSTTLDTREIALMINKYLL